MQKLNGLGEPLFKRRLGNLVWNDHVMVGTNNLNVPPAEAKDLAKAWCKGSRMGKAEGSVVERERTEDTSVVGEREHWKTPMDRAKAAVSLGCAWAALARVCSSHERRALQEGSLRISIRI